MASRAVRPETIAIDPLYFIPDGVEDLEYQDGIAVAADDIDENEFEVDIDIDLSDSSESDDTDYADAPETPLIIGILSQTVHMDNTGTEVVDVVFQVEDVFGADSYEMRVTKT